MSEILVFSHIPKTAGTSLNLALRAYYGRNLLAARERPFIQSSIYRECDYLKDKSIYKDVKCISGHGLKPWMDFGIYEQQMKWFTFLREPYRRFVSLYIHQQTNSVREKKMDLFGWSRVFDRSDGMVKMIAGEKSVDKAIDIIEKKMKFVGITEEYQKSIELMAKAFGLENFTYEYDNKRMTSRAVDLVTTINENEDLYEDCIFSNNVLDKILYDYVKKNIWPRQIASYDSLKSNEVIALKKINYIFDKRYRQFQYKDKLFYRPMLLLGML